MKTINIAIDGPAGAGKSSIAREVASQLGFVYVDTGALYRATALFSLEYSTREEFLKALEDDCHLELKYFGGTQCIFLNGDNVTEKIRTPEISMKASEISALPEVRAFLMELQRSLAREHSVIMDGRDIGTVVLPDAEVKVFLCADVETRARRRFLELEQRDYNDTHRAAAPLRPADDAIMIDNTDMDFAASLELLLDVIRGRVAS